MPDKEKQFDEINEVEDWPEPVNPEPSGEGVTYSDDKTIVKEFEAEDRNVSGLAAPNQLPYFVIVDGPRAGFRFPLEEGENLIGRATSCNITLDDKSVSRRHMTITHTDQGWVVRDEGSKNGTYVNGHKIAEPVNVGHKDTSQIGIYVLRLITKDISEEEEMAPPPKVEFEDVRDKSVSKRIAATEDDGDVTGSRKLVLDEAEAQGGGVEDLSLAKLGSQELALTDDGPNKAKPRYSLLLGILFAVLVGVGLFFYWKYVLKPPEVVPPATPVGEEMKEAKPVPKETPKPEKLPVFLDFASSPLPAKVVFLNKEIGTTPVRVNVELEIGKTYTAEATFFMPELREQLTERVGFTINEDQSIVPILFKGSIGMIKINDLPRDAEFYLEGYFEYDKFRAKPAKLSEIVFYKPIYVPYGKYLIELRRAKELAESGEYVQDIVYRRELVIQEDNPSFVVDITEEDLGFFPAEVHSKPNNADVYIGQKHMGQTPFKGVFPLGEHILTLKKDGYFDHTQKLKMDINTLYKVEIEMKTSEAGQYINEGRIEMQKGFYQNAIDRLVEVFKHDPTESEQAQTNYLIGSCYLNLSNYDGALGYFQKAQNHNDYRYSSMLGLVAVYNAQKDFGRALPILVEVLLKCKEARVLKDAHGLFQRISPLRSVMYIHTDPPGATIAVNDKQVEQVTPVILHDLALGGYRVTIHKDGFQDQHLNLNFSINEFNPVFVKLKPVEQ